MKVKVQSLDAQGRLATSSSTTTCSASSRAPTSCTASSPGSSRSAAALARGDPRALGCRPHRQEVRPPEGRRHRPSRRSPRPDLRRRRQGARPARVRDFDPSLNKKVRALGLKMALSAKAKDGNLIVARQPRRSRTPRPQALEGAARQARLRQERAGDRRRRAQRRLRRAPRRTSPGSTCSRRSAPTSTTF